MGGGITLLAVMLLFMEIHLVIPIHGVIQLVSNSSRVVLFRKHIHWPTFLRFSAGAIPFSFAGVYLVSALNQEAMKLVVGCFILTSLYFPFKKWTALKAVSGSFILAGTLAGSISLVVGATGPLIAPFFLEKGLIKEQVIASKAVCQALIHILKLIMYGAFLSFQVGPYLLLIIIMSLGVILGTWTGKKILSNHVSEDKFILLYRYTLTVIAAKILLYDGVYKILVH